MAQPLLPTFLTEKGVVGIELVGSSPDVRTWKVSMACRPSYVVKNVYSTPFAVLSKDSFVSRLGLGRYGPPKTLHSETITNGKGEEVLVEVRPFVDGCSVEEIWPYATSLVKASIFSDLELAVERHASVSQRNHGMMGNVAGLRGISGDTQSKWLRAVQRNHSCGKNGCEVKRLRRPKGSEFSVLHHGNMSPEHVIIFDSRIVAIVGWSGSEFAPVEASCSKYAAMRCSSEMSSWHKEWYSRAMAPTYLNNNMSQSKVYDFLAAVYSCKCDGYF